MQFFGRRWRKSSIRCKLGYSGSEVGQFLHPGPTGVSPEDSVFLLEIGLLSPKPMADIPGSLGLSVSFLAASITAQGEPKTICRDVLNFWQLQRIIDKGYSGVRDQGKSIMKKAIFLKSLVITVMVWTLVGCAGKGMVRP